MKALLVAMLLVGCSDGKGGVDVTPLDEQASIKVTTLKAQTDASMDFGEPQFVVEVTQGDDCFLPDASFGGTFRGVLMTVEPGLVLEDGSCKSTRLSIPFEMVTAANDVVEVHDKDTSVSATFASDALDIRTATFGWQFQAGNTNVMAWSHPIQGTPRMSFCIPAMMGSEVFRVWAAHPMGVVSDETIHFSLPGQVEFTGAGEAMIEVDGASGAATSCTGTACTYELDYFVIHSATVNP
jgi:hypothetical protein